MSLATTHRGLLGRPVKPLSEEEMKLFLALMIDGCEKISKFPLEKMKEQHSFQIALLRARAFHVNVSVQLLLWITCIAENPAHIVMWVYTMAVLQSEKKVPDVTIGDWMDAFQGVPTEDAYRAAWAEQKKTRAEREASGALMIDNWLDDASVWPELPPLPADSFLNHGR